jgi:hypothetical protein
MKLLTKELINKMPKIYSTDSIPLSEKDVICKFFNPCGIGTWYVLEGEVQDEDFIFFGLVDLHEKELGYFSLNELQSIRLPFGLKIERDLHFSKTKLSRFLDKA